MANVLFRRGDTATLDSTSITDGQLLYDTTTGQHYIDVGSTRIPVGKQVVDTALSTTSTNAIQNKSLTTSIINTTAEVSAITEDYVPCGTKPVKELITNLNGIVGTLTAGQTSITLRDTRITTDTTLLPATSIFGVNPTSATVVTGSVTYTFPAQATNMGVKAVIL